MVRVDDTAALDALSAVNGDMDRLGRLFIFLAIIVYVSLGCQLFRAIYLRPRPGGATGL